MDSSDSTPNKLCKTPEKRLIICRKANRKYYEKNKEKNCKRVLDRYYFNKEFKRLACITV